MKKIILLSVLLLLAFKISKAQEKKEITLFSPNLYEFLGLSEEQKAKISPLVEEIKGIQEKQRATFEEMRKKREAGEQFDREEMLKLREQREKDVNTMKSNIEKIKAELTEEQLVKFKEVQLPNFEMRRRNRP
ncbi:MAG TPA: Spy/CpxP family protein refolding chaperone [Bacteroidota bacterium]|nr:Spy/CpxP family protein refolding chaperone [Bacteroidota bacterium]